MLLQCHPRVYRKRHKSCVKTHDSITKYAHNSQAQRVFKTAPLYAVTNPEEAAPQSVLDAFAAFFESLWSPSTNPDGSTLQKAGMSYVYDEDGTLIAQTITGGAQSSWGQSARYVYLPTASGPMPVAAIYGTKHYAIQSDHLNTPRRLIQSDGQVAWQWAYSAFGEEKPTTAKTRFANADLNQSFGTTSVPAVTFNLRYPGQYFDQESNLHYNYHRSYHPGGGRYTQADPIGLRGGWNKYSYVDSDGVNKTDPTGLAPFDGNAWTGSQLGQVNNQTNCYRYAIDSMGYSNPNNSSLFPRATCENLINSAKKDGLIDPSQADQCGGECPSGYHKVQIFLDDKNIIDRDYHVFRQDDDGGWSHKLGRDGKPERSDSSGKALICPINAPKDYVTRNYTQYCGTLCVRETGFTNYLKK